MDPCNDKQEDSDRIGVHHLLPCQFHSLPLSITQVQGQFVQLCTGQHSLVSNKIHPPLVEALLHLPHPKRIMIQRI
jgi:hypothetical protein